MQGALVSGAMNLDTCSSKLCEFASIFVHVHFALFSSNFTTLQSRSTAQAARGAPGRRWTLSARRSGIAAATKIFLPSRLLDADGRGGLRAFGCLTACTRAARAFRGPGPCEQLWRSWTEQLLRSTWNYWHSRMAESEA